MRMRRSCMAGVWPWPHRMMDQIAQPTPSVTTNKRTFRRYAPNRFPPELSVKPGGMAPLAYTWTGGGGGGGGGGAPVLISTRGALAPPELVRCALHLQVPDDVADDRQQEPEAPHGGDR